LLIVSSTDDSLAAPRNARCSTCYREYEHRDPRLEKTGHEHARLLEHFEARGCPTVICDSRELRLIDGTLCVADRRIDLVYRRALASEIITRRSEIESLLRARR